jgi:hypothetical protein
MARWGSAIAGSDESSVAKTIDQMAGKIPKDKAATIRQASERSGAGTIGGQTC